jgi:hypothetical protein
MCIGCLEGLIELAFSAKVVGWVMNVKPAVA